VDFALIGWLAIIAAWCVWEWRGIKDGPEGWPTFTRLVKDNIPRWAVAAFLGWLTWHFLVEN